MKPYVNQPGKDKLLHNVMETNKELEKASAHLSQAMLLFFCFYCFACHH